VILTSTVRVSFPGTITQVATSVVKGRTVRRCRITRRVPTAGVWTVQCTMLRASRLTLRHEPLRLTLTTTFTATNGVPAKRTQWVYVAKRR
jgi:hypothetical protein